MRHHKIPKWGLLVRSVAVSAFSDLQIDAPWPVGQTKREVLWTQKLTDDTVMYLFGRFSEGDMLKSIAFSQPVRQQNFRCGATLDAETLEMDFRYVPNQSNSSFGLIGTATDLRIWKRDSAAPENQSPPKKAPVFDWNNRTLIFPAYAQGCLEELRKVECFKWPDHEVCPSSIVATQLSAAAFKLIIPVGKSSN